MCKMCKEVIVRTEIKKKVSVIMGPKSSRFGDMKDYSFLTFFYFVKMHYFSCFIKFEHLTRFSLNIFGCVL